ncbi:MAG TPA: non-canonical purine NTP pyrophosphatase, partial [Planctomycetota bacterium]|nr:non-canonical purine NTP pyrophosphatase [Planctomycetota bacterium]
MELLLASGNAKKAMELERMLAPLAIEVLRPQDVGGIPDVVEDQATFEGNARKKAVECAQATGRVCLADDSGLCVDALQGAPGVWSARYAGEHGNDPANNRKLLEALAGLPYDQRQAHFVCCLCVAQPDGTIMLETRGAVRGHILTSPQGDQGFGYDPLFALDEPESP